MQPTPQSKKWPLHPQKSSHVRPRLLQQPPTALFVNTVRVERQHRRHLVVVHLVVDIEVALLPATLEGKSIMAQTNGILFDGS